MDVQAYFEEWSRLPGETVRMAISTRHERVRATLERITRGPTKDDSDGAFRSFGVPVPGVDLIVAGRQQPTAIGSFAELPLGGAFGPSFALHFWFYSSVPDWEHPQTLVAATSDEDVSVALAIQKSELVVSVRGQTRGSALPFNPCSGIPSFSASKVTKTRAKFLRTSSRLKAFRGQRPFVKPELFSTARLQALTSFFSRPARSVPSVQRSTASTARSTA